MAGPALRFTAILLAGARSHPDPFVAAEGVSSKALIRIDDRPMIARVVETLKSAPEIGRIIIVSNDRPGLEAAVPGLFDADYAPGIVTAPAEASVCVSLMNIVARETAAFPFLVTTTDHPLLTPEMIAEFTRGAVARKAELVVGLVEKWLFRRCFPDNRRTFVPFRDTAVTGCNLFALMGPGGVNVLEFWRHVENRRKKPWRIFAQFGPWSLLLLLLRRYTLRQAFAGASHKLGVTVDLCCLSQAEAAIDVDKAEDLLLATDILKARRTAESVAHAIKGRGRRIAIFDLDRTITRRGTFTPYLLSAKRRPLVRFGLALRLAGCMALYKLGRLTRRELKNAMLAQTFRDASQSEIEASARHFVDRLMQSGLRETAQRAILHHKAAGDMLVLATASMDFYAEMIGRELGFDTVVATRTEWNAAGPRLAGENCYGSDKLTMLQAALDLPSEALDDSQLVFYSDHHTDMPVFTWAHQRVAVNPSRRLKALAEAQDIDIVYWA